MLVFKPLTLDDKNLFGKYIKPYNFESCEYSFTNLFIWRIGCDIQYTFIDDALIIKKSDFDGSYHFMEPLKYKKENLSHIVDTLIEYKNEFKLDYLFKDVEENFINNLVELYGNKLKISEDRNNFDYIYESQKLISLSGRKLHGQKNHYNNFIKNSNYRYEPLTHQIIDECIKASKRWCREKNCKGYLLYELKAIEELLKNCGKLDFIGMVVFVDEKLSAFTIGEKVNDKMAIIHIEKANPEINGLYVFINKAFVENNFSIIPFINREQDLGIEGLRNAKEAYKPIKMVKKFNVK
jgi:uncharacterized protein